MPYLTPTVGLFFYAPDYIKFVENLKYYLETELKFSDYSKYDEVNEIRLKNAYPIGVIDDVEIQFLHYRSENEAHSKWTRRVQRVNYDNLYLKFDDRDLSTPELMLRFDQISGVKNKVIFSAKKYPDINSLVFLPNFAGQDTIGDIYTDKKSYRKKFSVVAWLKKN